MSIHDELLTLMAKPTTDEEWLNIEWESRLITIPATLTNIGVYNDKDTNRLYFRCPIEYGEFKIADFGIHVNYQNTGISNTKYDGDVYFCDDVESDGDYLTFSWLVGRHAYLEEGRTAFIVCCKIIDGDDNVVNELNTTVATLSVLEGLEVDVLPPEDYPDYLEELLRRVEVAEETASEAKDAVQSAQDTANEALDKAQAVEDSALTGITVNGDPAPVNDHVAEIEVEGSGSVYCATVTDEDIRSQYVFVNIDGFPFEDNAPVYGTMLALWFDACTIDSPINGIYINGHGSFSVTPLDAIIPSQSGLVLFVCMGGVFVSSNDPALIREIQTQLTAIAETANEAKETADSALTKATETAESAITGVTVNGTAQPVNDNIAELTISGGESAIEHIQVNGDEQEIVDKTVNLAIDRASVDDETLVVGDTAGGGNSNIINGVLDVGESVTFTGGLVTVISGWIYGGGDLGGTIYICTYGYIGTTVSGGVLMATTANGQDYTFTNNQAEPIIYTAIINEQTDV